MWRELAERIEKLGVSQGLVQYEHTRKQVKYVLGRHSALKGMHSASSSPNPIVGRQPCILLTYLSYFTRLAEKSILLADQGGNIHQSNYLVSPQFDT